MILDLLHRCPLVASVQASEGAAVDDSSTLLKLAKCSLDQGVEVLRLQGVENVQTIKGATGKPVIGLIKKSYPGSDVYITPTEMEVQDLLNLGCEVIALDATPRMRPSLGFHELVAMIHQGGAMAMADCDSPEAIDLAVSAGCDLIGTTLAGYTSARPMTEGPDFDLVRYAVRSGKPIIAEGRYAHRWQVEAALRIGATAVVVGGAINDPVKQTRALMPSLVLGRAGAVDIGGTWLRLGVFEGQKLVDIRKIERPDSREERLAWVRKQIAETEVSSLGVGTGGTVDPLTGEVWEAKPIIPGHHGSIFSAETLGVPTRALNDGLATAWGHACHPSIAGSNVATLALGTGVGAGMVRDGKLICGKRGEYPRLNDVMTSLGRTIEDLLGGAGLSPNPTHEQQADAIVAFETAVKLIREMYYPDHIVVCGGVGLSPWLAPHLARLGCVASPYRAEAGLFGSMWLSNLH
ncbi:MAG: putative N-acetylmannosamine-6-phosphate 2-epimerase [Armatimonadota bacterium]